MDAEEDLRRLRELVRQGEGYRLEFKQSLSSIDRILMTLCAFANTEGGTVLVGVTDDGGIAGIRLEKDTEPSLVNIVLDSIRDPILLEVEIIRLEGKRGILRLSVEGHPLAAHTVKGRPFWRVGSVSKPMPQEEYERRIREKRIVTWETALVDEASESDLDIDAVKEYIKVITKRTKRDLKLTPGDVLLSHRCAVEQNGKLKPTRAGILLFGKQPQRFLDMATISVIRHGGRKVTDRVLDTRDFKGRLPDMIDGAKAYLLDNMAVMQKLVKGQARRQDIPQYPEFCIRELIVNAVAHREYAIYGSRIIIKMFRDRIEFHSPGAFPGDITPETALNKQFTRNPAIAEVLKELEYIEKFGMGLDRVFEYVREHPLKPELPSIQEIGELVIVTLHSPTEFLAPERKASEGELNERQEKALVYVRQKGRIDNSEYQQLNGVTRKTAARDLQDMVSKGHLLQKGERRGVHYLLA